jgi:hypothetical protein
MRRRCEEAQHEDTGKRLEHVRAKQVLKKFRARKKEHERFTPVAAMTMPVI